MQNNKISAVGGLVIVLVALVANHAIGRIGGSELHRVPVWDFPRAVGGWHAGADLPVDPRVQKILPTARIVDRVYSDNASRQISLTLLTATEYQDFHDPNMCFPAQGWELSPVHEVKLGDLRAYSMSAKRDNEKLAVLYFWTGGVIPEGQWGRVQLGRLMTIRNRLTNEQGQPVFVRLVTGAGTDSDKLLTDFAAQVLPPLNQLARASH